MSVSCQGVRSGRSSPHVNALSMTACERRERRAVAVVEGRVFVSELESQTTTRPTHGSSDDLGVGIEDELVGIESIAHCGAQRTVHAVAVELAGKERRADIRGHTMSVCSGSEIVTDSTSAFRRLEQAQFDPRRVFRKHGEVDADTVPCGAQRIRSAGQTRIFVVGTERS